MKESDFQEKLNSIQEKIGAEASNLILDEIGVLLTDNKAMNNTLYDKDKEIERLKKSNETLQNVNGNLLQQVAMGEDLENTRKSKEDEEPKKPYDFRSAFDAYGNFKQ